MYTNCFEIYRKRTFKLLLSLSKICFRVSLTKTLVWSVRIISFSKLLTISTKDLFSSRLRSTVCELPASAPNSLCLKIPFIFKRKCVSKPNRIAPSKSSIKSKNSSFFGSRSRDERKRTLRVVLSLRLITKRARDWLLTINIFPSSRKIFTVFQFSMFTKTPRWSTYKIITIDCFLENN